MHMTADRGELLTGSSVRCFALEKEGGGSSASSSLPSSIVFRGSEERHGQPSKSCVSLRVASGVRKMALSCMYALVAISHQVSWLAHLSLRESVRLGLRRGTLGPVLLPHISVLPD